MKLVPKPNQLKWLSHEDQVNWRGYFEDLRSAQNHHSRSRQTVEAQIMKALNGMTVRQKHYLFKGLSPYTPRDRAAITEGLKGLTTDRKHRLLKDLKNILCFMRGRHALIKEAK